MEKGNVYANGQIYAIRSHQTELIYIGSTCQPLHKRFYQHKKIDKGCSSKEIICYEDAYIELIEDFPCNSRKELNRREGQHIRNSENCVNKQVAGRTNTEWQREFKTANRDIVNQKQQEYRAINKDEINRKQREYISANRDEINRKQQEYRAAKKSKV
jgi:hypothetical protein